MVKVKVSVITINRNNERGLKATIKSVKGQIYDDYEYLIIDGASTDESVDVIKEYAEEIDYWVSEVDSGIYNAMNKGIERAKGDYLLFLNSGDIFYDKSVLAVFSSSNSSEDIVYGNIIYDDEKTALVMPDKISMTTFLGSSIGHGATFIKRELFHKFGLYNELNKIVSDWEFFMKVLIKAKCSYLHLNKIFTIYQKGGISTNSNYYQVQLEERKSTLKRMFPEFYDIFCENFELKNSLAFYENSRIIQLVKKVQASRLNGIRNTLRFKI